MKPELLEDEKTAGLSHEAFRLFVGLITLADDYGNVRSATAWLHGTVFWATDDAERFDVTKQAMEELVRVGLVWRYTVSEQTYAHLAGWEKHQRVDKPGPPRCPKHSDPLAIREPFANDSRGSSEPLVTDLDQDLDPDLSLPHSAPPTGAPPEAVRERPREQFDLLAIYRQYPSRSGKSNGLKKLAKAIKTQGDYDLLKQALASYLSSKKVREGYVKNFDTWAGCWDDYLEPEKPALLLMPAAKPAGSAAAHEQLRRMQQAQLHQEQLLREQPACARSSPPDLFDRPKETP